MFVETFAITCVGGVADSDLTKPWEGKISTSSLEQDGKTIHVIRC